MLVSDMVLGPVAQELVDGVAYEGTDRTLDLATVVFHGE